MALITLEPGESFEHRHDVDATSQLLEGQVRMDMGEQYSMVVGEVLPTPAGVLHCMVNTGTTLAIIKCAHTPPPMQIK